MRLKNEKELWDEIELEAKKLTFEEFYDFMYYHFQVKGNYAGNWDDMLKLAKERFYEPQTVLISIRAYIKKLGKEVSKNGK